MKKSLMLSMILCANLGGMAGIINQHTDFSTEQTRVDGDESLIPCFITLTSAPGTDNQSVCINTPIINITYSYSGSLSATFEGLPAGITGSYDTPTHVATISGTPTESGTFNYTVRVQFPCQPAATATGTITVHPVATIALTSPPGTNNQNVQCGEFITNIVYTLGGSSTGASASNLPYGVSGVYNAGTFTIHGRPLLGFGGTFFNYIVTTTGPCTAATATGTIQVDPHQVLYLTSAPGTNNQTLCVNTPITPIWYSVIPAEGGTATGLPPGVTGVWSDGVFIITGTPSEPGTYDYTVTTSGGSCSPGTTTGTITVMPNATITGGINGNQVCCVNLQIIPIFYTLGGGASGAFVTGLPPGVYWASNASTCTIVGSPTSTGVFPFTVFTTGTCVQTSAPGSIFVSGMAPITMVSEPGTNIQTTCINNPITNIQYTATGNPTSVYATGLPPGISGVYSGGLFMISGAPTSGGVYSFAVHSNALCSIPAYGTITVYQTTPGPAGAISGPAVVDTGQAGVIYNTAAISGATGYSWTLPPGAVITGGDNTNSITVSFGTTAVSGMMTVKGTNTCGPGAPSAGLAITVTVPSIITLSGNSSGVACYNALQTINVGGNGLVFTVMTGDSAIMISGQKILYHPVSRVLPGGYLHGYVSDNFCGINTDAMTISANPGIGPEIPEQSPIFRLYPNPTSGAFTIELSSKPGRTPVRILCFNLLGELIIEKQVTSGIRHDCTLSDRRPGIYLVRIIRDGETGTVRIIRLSQEN